MFESTSGAPHGQSGVQIAGEDHACANNCTDTDAYALDDHGAGADEGTFADLHAATQGCAWRNVDVLTDDAVVINAGARVDDDIAFDAAIWLDDGPCHDLHAIGQPCAAGHPGCRMNQGRKREADRI